MAKCKLKILLEDDRRSFRAGEKLRGVVDVRADAPLECRSITVEIHWQASGSGIGDKGGRQSIEVFGGELTGGTPRTFPFALDLPRGPFSYSGEVTDVRWYITARADIPRARDLSAKEEIRIHPNPALEPEWGALFGEGEWIPQWLGEFPESGLTPSPEGRERTVDRAFSLGCLSLIYLSMGGAVLGSLVLLLKVVHRVSEVMAGQLHLGKALPVIAGAVMVNLFTILYARAWVRNVKGSKNLGEVDFTVEPRLLRGGDEVKVSLSLRPRKNTKIRAISFELSAMERAITGRKGRRTSFHTAFSETADLSSARTLRAGLPVRFTGSLKVPEGAPASFELPHNSLEWNVKATIAIEGWRDWSEEKEVLVCP